MQRNCFLMNQLAFHSKTSYKLQATSKGLIRPNKATKPKEKYYAANRAGPQTKGKHYNQIRTELAIFYM
jgi:hypothetical protein